MNPKILLPNGGKALVTSGTDVFEITVEADVWNEVEEASD